MSWKRCKFFSLLVFTCLAVYGYGQNSCSVKNTVFKPGEKVTYKIYYHWNFVWLESAEVTFVAAEKNYYGTPCYYFTGCGSTYKKYDWFYKVRDTFRGYVDTASFTSQRFIRITNEGSNHISNDNVFDNTHHKAYCLSKDNDSKYHEDSVKFDPNTYDVLAGVYFTRCLDFSKCNANDTIPVKLYLDGHTYNIHLRYLGKEETASSLGRFKCIKFSVSLISGTIFKEGEEMNVWVTDDGNRLPILIEAPIIVGEVRAELQSFSNLRNPMDAKVK